MSDAEVKTCSKCGETKPLSEFIRRPNTNRYYGVCKACKVIYAKEYREKNREEISKRRRAKYHDNIDEMRERNRAYYAENREKIRERGRQYYKDNADILNARTRAYYREHVEEIKAQKKVYNAEHKEEQRAWHKAYAEKHKDRIAEYHKVYNQEHAEEKRAYLKKYVAEHKEELAEKKREYNEKNRELVRERNKNYAKKNRAKIRAYHEQYRRERVEKDPLFKMSVNLRHLVANSLRRQGYTKKTRTAEIVGCDFDTLWEHLKQTWVNNYGQEWNGEPYHIDHIIPLATAKNEQDIIDLFHYTNLQMLKPEHNLDKKDKLEWQINKVGNNE